MEILWENVVMPMRRRGAVIFSVDGYDVDRYRVYKEGLSRHYGRSKYSILKGRVLAIDVLRAVKMYAGYKEIASVTNVPTSILCRYTRGNIIPKFEQAISIISSIMASINLGGLLRMELNILPDNPIDTARLVRNPYLTRLVAVYIMLENLRREFTAIVASNPVLVGIASLIADELGSKIIVVQKRRFPGRAYYEGIVVRPYIETSSLYIDKDMLSTRDRALVLTDIVYSGRTLRAVLDMLEKARVSVESIYSIIVIGRGWKRIIGDAQLNMLLYIQ